MPKTVISPCMGVGKIVASVTRRAAYQVKGQCPEDVEILSLPALLAGDPQERQLIQNNPSIIIDGCALRCGAHIFKLFGVEPAAKVEVSQIMKENKLGPGKTRKELEETGKRLSAFTAERVLKALTDELLTEGFVPVDELAQSEPEPGCGCPHRGLAAAQSSTEAANVMTGASRIQGEAEKEAAELAGVCSSGPEGQATANGKHRVQSVTILPCQGIKRSGGRVTQRAAYHVVEDRYLGKTNLLCISALAAGVQEDVDMLEKYPTVAINGCAKRCASIAAEHHGIPAAAAVDLHEIDMEYPCETHCLEPDLTEAEAQEALKLAEAVNAEVDKLIGHEIDWKPGKINLHGLVHESSKINALTGFGDPGKGFLVKLAKHQLEGTEQKSKNKFANPALPARSFQGGEKDRGIISAGPNAESLFRVSERNPAPGAGKEDLMDTKPTTDEFPGVQKVVAKLFRPKQDKALLAQGTQLLSPLFVMGVGDSPLQPVESPTPIPLAIMDSI